MRCDYKRWQWFEVSAERKTAYTAKLYVSKEMLSSHPVDRKHNGQSRVTYHDESGIAEALGNSGGYLFCNLVWTAKEEPVGLPRPS